MQGFLPESKAVVEGKCVSLKSAYIPSCIVTKEDTVNDWVHTHVLISDCDLS